MKPHKWLGASFLIMIGVVPLKSVAQSGVDCGPVFTRSNVVRCAVAASMQVRSERLGLASLDGRRTASSLLLPSNPTLSVTGGLPAGSAAPRRDVLWSATLAQELEIGGQRGARLDIVKADERAQQARLDAARRDAAASAFTAYFDALAANETARLAERLGGINTTLLTLAGAQVDVGLAAPAEAAVAEAASIQLAETRLAARQRAETSRAVLAASLGLEPTRGDIVAEGELTPLDVVAMPPAALLDAAPARRADLSIALAERQAQERRITLLQRSRLPNPTVSVFASNDWIDERRVGVGLALPLPLPAPVGRTYAGEIAEAQSLAERASAEAERIRRTVQLDVTTALQAVVARRARVELYDRTRVQRAEVTLGAISDELASRRLPLREALLMQRALLEMLFGYVEARRQLCLASVELARAAGVSFEGGLR